MAYPKRYVDDERRRDATQPLAALRVEAQNAGLRAGNARAEKARLPLHAAAGRLLRFSSLTCHPGHAGVVVPCIQPTGALNARRSGIPTGS